jgi:hypothetical protein
MTTKTKTHLKLWTFKVEMHNAHIGLWNWKKNLMWQQKPNKVVTSVCHSNLPCSLCRNPSLGFVIKARACKGAGQERSLGITFHVLRSVGECEGMNPHTPKWVPILGIRILMDFQIFRMWLQGSKSIGLKSYLHHQKALRT